MVQMRQIRFFRSTIGPAGVLLIATAMAVVTGMTAASASSLAPAAATPASLDWQLDFAPGDLRLYVDPVDGRRYWYFTYTVTNQTERDLVFAPRIELFMDSGEVLRSGRGVPSRVIGQLKKLLGNPLLEDQNRIIGDLRVGKENARTGIAVWPAEDQDITEVTLFFQGLSSDRKVVKHPKTNEPVSLYRTLRREYVVPGDPEKRGSAPLALDTPKNRRGPMCELEFQIGGKSAGCWIYR
ncbi:MAG: hypothetical protein OSA40_05400 [Phycisphaerales bacterium]|jgi:hypothetical protein|nr:hypothetical protein [Phycisphaerales bacterium]